MIDWKKLFYFKLVIIFVLRVFTLAILISLVLTINFPLYKQCDSRWASEQLGTSSNTICSAGCLMSSSAMALYGIGNTQFNPSTLNKWLTANGGYVSGDLYVWAAVNKFGLTFRGFISNNDIKKNLDAGNIVIVNVHNGGHWVLATGYDGDNIKVNDPGYTTTSYTLSQIVNGNTGVYTINRLPNFINNFFSSVSDFFSFITGSS